MPYKGREIPSAVKNLPAGAQAIFRKTFNAVFASTNDETKARMAAWANVKNEYTKVSEGSWKAKKEEPSWSYKVDNKMRSYGEIDEEKKTIRINPHKGDTVDTIIHERLHKEYPDKSEKWIKEKAKNIIRKMSLNKQAELLKKFAKK